MTRLTPEFDQRIADWLEDDPGPAPSQVTATILAALPSIRQRRRAWLPPGRRIFEMPDSLRLGARIGAVAVAGVVAGVVALSFLSGAPGPGGGPELSPTPTAAHPAPTTQPTVAPTASAAAAGPFTSPLYGYTVTRPAGWTVTPATEAWRAGTDPSPDLFESPVSTSPEFGAVYVAAQPVPKGVSPEEWQREYAESVEASLRDCKGPADAWIDDTVGALEIRRLDLECQGVPGETLDFTEVAFVIDDTGYVMAGNPTIVAQFLAEIEAGA